MKRLTIIRHAKSSWADAGMRDFDRPLNARGEHDAPLVGRWLAGHGGWPQHVLCSTARRTRQTASLLFADAAGEPPVVQWEDALYLADTSMLLKYIRAVPAEVNHLAVLAHNPGVSELFYRLCPDHAVSMPTCAVAILNCDIRHWSRLTEGRLEAFVCPRALERDGR